MSERIQLSYFYGKEAEQFSFYRIPKLLFTEEHFKSISVEAKVLYGLMLDRMALSIKNQWLDQEGRAYIYYSLEEIMEDLGCKNNKATAILKELDIEQGIGLIERKRQGQGKPTLIYVKQFIVGTVQKWEKPESGKKEVISEMGKTHVLTLEKPKSRDGKIQSLDSDFSHANKTNINNTKQSENKSNLIQSKDAIGSDAEAYATLINKNLNLEALKAAHPHDADILDGIHDLILETVLSTSSDILIAASLYPAALVRGKFLKLQADHIEYILECLHKNGTQVRNIKKYLLAALFNAPSTIGGYYQAEVNHDLAGVNIIMKERA